MGEIDQRRGRERLEQIRSRELQQRKRPRHCAGVDAAWTPCCGHCSGTPRSRPRVGRRGASRVRGTSATVSQQRGRKFAESERRGGSRGRGRAFLRTLRPVCPSLALTPHTDLSSVALGCHGHRRVASSTLAPSEPELRGFVRSFVRVCGAPFAKHCVGMSLAARLLRRASRLLALAPRCRSPSSQPPQAIAYQPALSSALCSFAKLTIVAPVCAHFLPSSLLSSSSSS